MTRYLIDPGRSRVVINVSSSVHPIHSETDGLEGWLDVDVRDGAIDLSSAPSGRLELPVTRLRSGNPLEDRELKRRIDAKRHPTISGQLTGMEPAGPEGVYRTTGDVTFRGETRSCSDDLTITIDDDDTVRVRGSSVFDVREFGMEPPRILMLRVHPEVKVEIDVVATKDA